MRYNFTLIRMVTIKNKQSKSSTILSSREKGGAYTLCTSMYVTGEHYAKWNKPDGEEQISYDLTFNWNIIKRRKKETKYKQRHWN